MCPIYEYLAYDSQGKEQKGLIEAENDRAARQKVKKRGLIVTSVQEKNAQKSSNQGGIPFIGGRISAADIALATRQLASLVKANIPLVEALNALVEQTEKEKLKVIFSQVRQDVNEGSSLAKALVKHPKAFDIIFINMVEAGESSGTLGLVLLRLADLKEAQMRLRSKVINGMTYPVLMLGLAVVLMIGIFAFVIPKLTKIFDSMNRPIPATTKILILVSDTFTQYWYLFVLAGFISIYLFRRFVATPQGQAKWDAFRLKVPVFGRLTRMIAVTRFANTMSTLLKSGVPILTSMGIAKNLMGNSLISAAVENARANITEGQSIAEPLRKSGEFPPLVTHMISIGERTGELPEMLNNVSETYEQQVNVTIEQMTSLLEPIMIVGMGIMVGFIVISIFVPLLDISNIQ